MKLAKWFLAALPILTMLISGCKQPLFTKKDSKQIVKEDSTPPCETYALWFNYGEKDTRDTRIALPDGRRFTIPSGTELPEAAIPGNVITRVYLSLSEDAKNLSGDGTEQADITCLAQAHPDAPARIPAAAEAYVDGSPFGIRWLNFVLHWYSVRELQRAPGKDPGSPLYLFPGKNRIFIHDARGQFQCSCDAGKLEDCHEKLGFSPEWETILTIEEDDEKIK